MVGKAALKDICLGVLHKPCFGLKVRYCIIDFYLGSTQAVVEFAPEISIIISVLALHPPFIAFDL